MGQQNTQQDWFGQACEWCGQAYVPVTKRGRFCSNRCRCAWNANKKRVEKRIRRAVEDSLWLCDLAADDPVPELVAASLQSIAAAVDAIAHPWEVNE
jgi:hypothetical protein